MLQHLAMPVAAIESLAQVVARSDGRASLQPTAGSKIWLIPSYKLQPAQ